MNEQRLTKIFISHSSQDLMFVQPLVELLEALGLTDDNMFCSSVSGYNVPLDKNIYDYLKEQFQNFNLRVVFMLSDNYYRSVASMNEMGAAWVLQSRYTSVLLPQFRFKDIKGAIDPLRISIKLDSGDNELKARLNELKDTLVNEFELRPLSQNIWERYRDKFICQVRESQIKALWDQLHQLGEKNQPDDAWIEPLKKLVELDQRSFDAIYMLGIMYAKINDLKNSIRCVRRAIEVAESDDQRRRAKEKLRELSYRT